MAPIAEKGAVRRSDRKKSTARAGRAQPDRPNTKSKTSDIAYKPGTSPRRRSRNQSDFGHAIEFDPAESGGTTTQQPSGVLKRKAPDIPAVSMPKGKIHPIVVFPISGDGDNKDLKFLYTELVARLAKDRDYARPITVMDFKTYYNNTKYKHDNARDLRAEFLRFLSATVLPHSRLIRAWCVDTCQMWNTGLGAAFNEGGPGDIYWLIPGDFFYARRPDIIELVRTIPEAVQKHGQDFCIGEISVDVNSAKQLIDTYGTYGLLYNWFPQEAQRIRQKTDKPRSEFFAIGGSFLEDVLRRRWYGYEQTIVMLLHGITSGKQIHKVSLDDISDLPQGRETLAAAMQQVERTERVLKMVWRERNDQDAGWIERFRVLDQQSGQVRAAALIILQNLLG